MLFSASPVGRAVRHSKKSVRSFDRVLSLPKKAVSSEASASEDANALSVGFLSSGFSPSLGKMAKGRGMDPRPNLQLAELLKTRSKTKGDFETRPAPPSPRQAQSAMPPPTGSISLSSAYVPARSERGNVIKIAGKCKQ